MRETRRDRPLMRFLNRNKRSGASRRIKIKLTKEEAIVLSELLYRISEKQALYEDIAEQYVLWSIEAQLDPLLVEPLMKNYSEILKASRKTVRENY